MQVHSNINMLPVFRNAVVTIGTFDGVHTGHQQIIAQLKQEAAEIGGETVIITFHPHPRKVVMHKEVFILNTLAEKIELLQEKAIDHLVVVPFNEHFAQQTAKEYVEHFLFERFHPHTVIIGYDHRFGQGRKGDYHLLEEFGGKLGFIVKEIPEHVLNNIAVSSTKIREALLNSDVTTANNYLGYDYFFEGTVIEGNKLGRTLGYPTANLQIETTEKLIPGNGVYAVIAAIEQSSYKAMMNIGVRPTVDGTKRMIEVNIFDFNQDIYGKILRVYIKQYLRGEVKFNGLDALKEQLALDKISALKVL
ncbi:bifunctional riboflavin kinase/FAD synthetase [Panacibacter ginsenosidivorans]|uniref:Riboflavin biosynthesis protein n=1 Tax=Panacibacter ginsenosidivorans TaxID=1813871 RepID=A0A5B8VBN6_9BACT|nr:bifunctional riboflavin kinase/FAD synthetase [Panacibacter ginsenosidivorans]QEC68096.1 bifunctional riboflavin kinase/FAD synthetase [Panacibacter ginsenosidivorans]